MHTNIFDSAARSNAETSFAQTQATFFVQKTIQTDEQHRNKLISTAHCIIITWLINTVVEWMVSLQNTTFGAGENGRYFADIS